MGFGQVPSDDEVPDYHPFLQAAAGMQVPASIAAPQAAQPTVAAPQVAAPPQAQAPPIAAAPTQANPPAAPAVLLPPTAPDPQIPQYQAMMDTRAKDAERKTVAPKWYERLGGGLVGFGAGYHGDVAGGIRAGSQITNRGQIAEDEARAARLDADDRKMADFRTQQQMQHAAYEDQVTNYNAQRGAQNDAFSHDMQTKEYQRGVDNDQREQGNRDRDYKLRSDGQVFEQNMQTQQAQEHQKEFQAQQANEDRRIGVENTRVGLEREQLKQNQQDRDDQRDAKAEADLVKRRDGEYDAANKQFDKEASEAASDSERQAVESRRAAKSGELQSRWNGEFSRFHENHKERGPAPVRTVNGPHGKMQITIENGRWVDAKTKKPI